MAAILMVAAALRLWHLGTLPEGVWFDEVDSQHSAISLLSMPFQPFAVGNAGHNPSLYFYVMALVLNTGGSAIGMIRLSSALFGLLAVVGVYLLGRQAGGSFMGLCAAALMALSQWAITFSRFGMSNIAAPAGEEIEPPVTRVSRGVPAAEPAPEPPNNTALVITLAVVLFIGAVLLGLAAFFTTRR